MDSQDQRGAVSRLVQTLRRITRIVQILPFAYLLLMGLYLVMSFALPNWILGIADNVFNTPVYAVIGMLGAGRILKLCNWFRTACLLPMATKIESWIDSFVITFTQEEVIIINMAIGILFLIYIYLANNHFFHGRRTEYQRRVAHASSLL